MFSKFSVILGIKGFCEVDDQRCLDMFDRCSRVAK